MFKGSIAADDIEEVVTALKSAAEPTRLRLLHLLAHAEYTVGELCAVLGQSQPRVSRHLRLLTEAGLLDRFREQQCVYYRAPVGGRKLAWLRQMLAMVNPDAAVLRLDRERAGLIIDNRALVAAQQLGQAPASAEQEGLASRLLEVVGPATIGELLDIGTGSGLMLAILGPRARRAVGVDISTPALRLARTRIHSAGLSHCEFRRGDMYRLPFDDVSFDTVTIDRVLAAAQRPTAVLMEVARVLRPSGRLIVIEDFDLMEGRGADNPLSQLRRWFDAAGLHADRLHPGDLAGRHVIVALVQHQPAPASFVPTQQAIGRA
jgi:DNA-binding transcriptional ArsR family regulator/protein-L-isoaspartate O-methyltransferase